MFLSQDASSPHIVSVSQMMPTLQLSGDIPLSQSYEGFKPGRSVFFCLFHSLSLFSLFVKICIYVSIGFCLRLCANSPTSGTTSTPLRQFPLSSNDLGNDVISLSDEEDAQKLGEKRKLSDSSDETKPDLKRVKQSFHSRPSVVVVEEVNIFKNPSTEVLEQFNVFLFLIYMYQT